MYDCLKNVYCDTETSSLDTEADLSAAERMVNQETDLNSSPSTTNTPPITPSSQPS